MMGKDKRETNNNRGQFSRETKIAQAGVSGRSMKTKWLCNACRVLFLPSVWFMVQVKLLADVTDVIMVY